jgi:hypothetical protein
MVLCASRETLSLKFLKTSRASSYYTGSKETSHAPKFEWPERLNQHEILAFKQKKLTENRIVSTSFSVC